MGSYSKDDCIFLLKNINGLIDEQGDEEREGYMKDGTHYSEMLPIEYMPTEEYMNLFCNSLKGVSKQVSKCVAYVSELILKERGEGVVLVSLARGGTPIGVLIKRYLKEKYNLNIPYYSVSIVRGKGFDENAIAYILNKHNIDNLQFVDGWTGKGAINKELNNSAKEFNEKFTVSLNPSLAVLAAPSQSVEVCGTRKDFLIPSACLNSTVSGLISGTVQREDLIGEYDFHGAKYYTHLEEYDLTNYFVDEISKHFSENFEFKEMGRGHISNSGMKEVMKIKDIFDIEDINKIKPGVGETTRVLLRRVPWKILVNDMENPDIEHILLLAQNRKATVEVFKDMTYSCVGLIKEL